MHSIGRMCRIFHIQLFLPPPCSTTVFSHSQTVVLCGSCSTVLCTPTGGRARLTEGECRRRVWCTTILAVSSVQWLAAGQQASIPLFSKNGLDVFLIVHALINPMTHAVNHAHCFKREYQFYTPAGMTMNDDARHMLGVVWSQAM